jgi:hypothetical protein
MLTSLFNRNAQTDQVLPVSSPRSRSFLALSKSCHMMNLHHHPPSLCKGPDDTIKQTLMATPFCKHPNQLSSILVLTACIIDGLLALAWPAIKTRQTRRTDSTWAAYNFNQASSVWCTSQLGEVVLYRASFGTGSRPSTFTHMYVCQLRACRGRCSEVLKL